MIEIGTDFSGVGAFEQALIRLDIDYKTVFACEIDKYARQTYIANYGTSQDLELLKTEDVKFINDIYYRGFVNTKLKTPTQKEWDKVNEIEERVANKFSFYYPWNVYSRKIPTKSLGIFVPSPPCQGFSLAGKRGGSIFFLNSHQFIQQNKPRYFIFENVKGLLSHDKRDKKAQYGNTFNEWINYLGGKTVNGNPVIFPQQESVPYHIYHKVINAKNCGVPQNRERVFIVGIRDDADNNFTWPKDIHLTKRLKDVLEENVDEKYYLSDNAIKSIIQNEGNLQKSKVNPEIANTLQSPANALTTVQKDNVVVEPIICEQRVDEGLRFFNDNISGTIRTIDSGGDKRIIESDYKIRRLTPRECFRLMDFPNTFKIDQVSNTQAYRQAGNSIVVACLTSILKKLL